MTVVVLRSDSGLPADIANAIRRTFEFRMKSPIPMSDTEYTGYVTGVLDTLDSCNLWNRKREDQVRAILHDVWRSRS